MEKLKKIWNLCGMHLVMILCGAVLLLFPNSAVALVTKLLAWILVIAGVYNVIKNLTGKTGDVKSWVFAVLYLAVGGYMLSHPLVISELVGRVLGLILVVQGLGDLRRSQYGAAKALGGLTLAGGIVLMLIPRTLVNTLLALVGLVLIVVGVINCLGKLRLGGRLEEHNDPSIIDADE